MDMLTNYSTWFHALTPDSQAFVMVFWPCALVFSGSMIYKRIKIYRFGEAGRSRWAKAATLLGWLGFFGGTFYLADRFPLFAYVISWPARLFPFYAAHRGAMVLAFFCALVAANVVAAVFAALFLRGSGLGRNSLAPSPSHGGPVRTHTLLPDPPPGYGWFSPPATKRTRIARRTIHSDWEDE